MVKISRDFAGDLEAGDVEAAAKAAGAAPATGTAGLFLVARKAIKVLPGFNVRAETSDYKAHIEDLRMSLIAEGWYKHKPLAAYVVKEGAKDVIYCVEGHSRLAAYDDAAAAGKRIGPIPVVFEGKARSVEDLTAQLANANKSRPYGPLELSVIVHRLDDYGWDANRIAAKIGKTDRYVRDLLVLVDAPATIRNMIAKGQVSATEAIKVIRTEGDDAAEVLKASLESAEASGRKRATAKHTEGQRKAPKPARVAAARDVPEVTSVAVDVASDADFLLAAIDYGLTVATDTREWLQRWRDGDTDALGELETFMGQPIGSMSDRDLRVPMPTAEGEEAGTAEAPEAEAAADEVFENVAGRAERAMSQDDAELLGEETPPAFATEPKARRKPSAKATAKVAAKATPAARKAPATPAAIKVTPAPRKRAAKGATPPAATDTATADGGAAADDLGGL
jgi:ParB family chromosome partitioning protein